GSRSRAVRDVFWGQLRDLLNATDQQPADGAGDLVVPPPIYGCWHTARTTISPDAATPPRWLRDLNLDPRNRAAASFGTRVVQEQQEHLMASAWEQVGEIERVNQAKRQA